jgi:aspartate racemase
MPITRLGIVGGVGPAAAAHFYQRLIALSGVHEDAHHLPVVMVSNRIPSRIAHLTGTGESPVPALRDAARRLADSGADAIALPSATTHAYRQHVVDESGVPVFDLLAEVGRELAAGGYRRPLFLATAATTRLRLYEHALADETTACYPAADVQRAVSEYIDDVKRGVDRDELRRRYAEFLRRCEWSDDVDVIVHGCTELSVIAPAVTDLPSIDVTDVLARAVLSHANLPGPGVR